MKYTNESLIKKIKQTDNGPQEEVISAQEIFSQCMTRIQENTPSSNLFVKQTLQTFPELALMKNADDVGQTLLIYAADCSNAEAVKAIINLPADVNAVNDSTGQTALHYAVLRNHPEIVELLINAGADVNLKDKRCDRVIGIASSEGYFEIVKKITAVAGVLLDYGYEYSQTPLYLAALNGHRQVVEHLIGVGAKINWSVLGITTALHGALYENQVEIAELLIAHGANLNIKDKFGQTPLYLAVRLNNIELVKSLMENGADPSIRIVRGDTVFDLVTSSKDIGFFKALCNQDRTQNLYQAIVNNDLQKAEKLVSENQYTEDELRAFYLFSINNHKFAAASILWDHQDGLRSKYSDFRSVERDKEIDKENSVNKATLCANLSDIYRRELRVRGCLFKGTPFADRAEQIEDAFVQIKELLCDVETCIELLQPLDNELSELLPQLGDFKSLKNIIVNGLLWPAAEPENYKPMQKNGALRMILRSYLQNHGIETQEELFTFSGFVETEAANAIVRKGGLFKEQFLIGNVLAHGLYAHYIQWFLVARAADTGRIKLAKDLSLRDVLQASVDVQTRDKSPAWVCLVDNLTVLKGSPSDGDKERLFRGSHDKRTRSIPYRYRFSSPQELTSFLYTSSQLPHLRAYLLDSLYKYIRKIRFMMKLKFPESEPIEHHHIITGQVVGSWSFSRFDLGFFTKDVDQYYKENSKSKVEMDLNTGIITKSVKVKSESEESSRMQASSSGF